MTPARTLAAVCAATMLLGGCAEGPGTAPPTGVDGLVVPTPSPDPDDFVEDVDNPWLPLEVGNEWVYESTGDRTVTVDVTGDGPDIAGVVTTEVHEVVTDARDAVLEETTTWFAQDREGNVWTLGEKRVTYAGGDAVDVTGSWRAGTDGARAGLAMPAQPRVGDGYRRADPPGKAEVRVEVLSLAGTQRLEGGAFDALLVAGWTSPAAPGVTEHRYYARSVGLVVAETVSGGKQARELVSFTEG